MLSSACRRTSEETLHRLYQADVRLLVFNKIFLPRMSPSHPKLGETLTAKIWFVNYGKAPAIRALFTSKIVVGNDALKQADKYFESFGKWKVIVEGSEVVAPPGIPPNPESAGVPYDFVHRDAAVF